MPNPTSGPEEKEFRQQVLRYMECGAQMLRGQDTDASRSEMRSIRAVTGLAHEELLALGADILLEDEHQ